MSISKTLHTSAIPLSLQQEFLCLFDKGDAAGPFGPRYHIVDGWRLRGRLDLHALRGALDDTVARHEALRTVIVRTGAQCQQILPPSSPALVVRELASNSVQERDAMVEDFLNEVESETMDVHRFPLLRAVLGRFDDRDAVLVLVVHHTAADAWSMHVILRDLAAYYAARRGYGPPNLPAAAQYREFAVQQRAAATTAATQAARGYWREKLRGAQLATVNTDHPTDSALSAQPTFYTSWHRFAYDEQLRTAAAALAADTRSSQFMVLAAAFKVFLYRLTGISDLVVPTFMPGRGQSRMQNTVGSFFNFVPLRTDLAGCRTFRDVIGRTRITCLQAYKNELPLAYVLAEAPGLMQPMAEPGRVPCVFQVVQSPYMMDRELIGDMEYSYLWRRVQSQPVGSDIPDGMLWSLQLGPTNDVVGQLGYSRSLFEKGTVTAMVAEYAQVLAELLTTADSPLALDH